MRTRKDSYFKIVILFVGLMSILLGIGMQKSFAETVDFAYTDSTGQRLTNGTAVGNTYNYDYGHAPEAVFDEENYVNYADRAYLKKSVKEDSETQGLFDVTLDVKGNQIGTPIDLVLVIDYSSSMTGEKLTNGNIRVGIVAYNREVYSTNGFSSNMNDLENFLKYTAESHSGTFMQKGLLAGQRLLLEKSRPEAEKLFIHIGDDSANRSYLPVQGAKEYPNEGEIIDYNGYHTDRYIQDFQTDSDKYYTTNSNPSDPNAISVSSSIVTDATLGTIVSLKHSGFTCYSIATAPSARGEYIGRNLASKPQQYLTTDENLSGLGSALTEIANQIDKTIPNGTITDPMGQDILLQGAGEFNERSYQLVGWRKNEQGNWEQANDVVADVVVSEANQTITIANIALGENERLTCTYQVRLNTENTHFKGETWYLCNGRTTLAPTNESELLDFPIPSIKAPTTTIQVAKKWKNVAASEIPETIDYVISRSSVVDPTSWQSSAVLSLRKQDNYQATIKELPVGNEKAVLPKYNNQGEDFTYQVAEVNVPDEFESTVTNNGNSFVITNTKKTTEPSTTEPSTTEPSTTESSMTESSAIDLRNSGPSTTKKEAMLQIASESSTDSEAEQLPKTNEHSSSILVFLGTMIVGSVGYYLIRKIR
ncbi:LPXTG cell wall anchor domain-containing protein [Enterococcus gallinarum]|uniref:LPXTG cell wall anchor domain-containing protein n=1 Tax=Enterococcus gallinarum TaxID=1353 RepID=UPI0015E33E4B|nr:LPXTG cell wall anchor domain-containing protein [Enterococcus gallinarum]MBA0962215.1 Cna B-type domain-containing protein [Enterococcus gallinarum]